MSGGTGPMRKAAFPLRGGKRPPTPLLPWRGRNLGTSRGDSPPSHDGRGVFPVAAREQTATP